MQQQASKRIIEFEATKRKEKNLPSHKVQVIRHGKIDGACEGKDAWETFQKVDNPFQILQ
jgi:hypothetical protein